MGLVTEMIGQLDLHRAFHHPLRQLAEQAALPGDLLTRLSVDYQLMVPATHPTCS